MRNIRWMQSLVAVSLSCLLVACPDRTSRVTMPDPPGPTIPEPKTDYTISFPGASSIQLNGTGDTKSIEYAIYKNGTKVNEVPEWTSSDPAVEVTDKTGTSVSVRSRTNDPIFATLTGKLGSQVFSIPVHLATLKQGVELLNTSEVSQLSATQFTVPKNDAASLQTGQVVIIGGDRGVVARITDLKASGANSVVTYQPAALEEAFKEFSSRAASTPTTLQVTRARSGATTLSVLRNGKVQTQQATSGFTCSAEGGGAVNADLLTGASFTYQDKVIVHHDVTITGGKLQRFALWMSGDVELNALSGSLTAAAAISAKCIHEFDATSLPTALVGPLRIGVAVTPTVGFKLDAAVKAGGVKMNGPQLKMTRSFQGGVEYTSAAGWKTVKDSEVVNTDSFEMGSAAGVPPTAELSFGPFMDLKFGVKADLAGLIDVAKFDFVKVSAGGDFKTAFSARPDPTFGDYESPTWQASLGVKAALSTEMSSGMTDVTSKIKFTPVTLNLNLSLFDASAVMGRSPTISLVSSAATVQKSGQVTLTAQTSIPPSSGEVATAVFYRVGTDNALVPLGQVPLTGNQAKFVWTNTLPVGQVARFTVRLKQDAFSRVFSYAPSAASLPAVTVTDPPPPPPPPPPVVNSIHLDSVTYFYAGQDATTWYFNTQVYWSGNPALPITLTATCIQSSGAGDCEDGIEQNITTNPIFWNGGHCPIGATATWRFQLIDAKGNKSNYIDKYIKCSFN